MSKRYPDFRHAQALHTCLTDIICASRPGNRAMCNLDSLTTNVEAIRRLFTDDWTVPSLCSDPAACAGRTTTLLPTGVREYRWITNPAFQDHDSCIPVPFARSRNKAWQRPGRKM